MREFVKRLGLPLDVAIVPDLNNPKHGEIKGATILIYDSDPEIAWTTLLHETAEYRLKALTSLCRRLVYKLLEDSLPMRLRLKRVSEDW